MSTQDRKTSDQQLGSSEIITDIHRIAPMLEQLHKRHAPLTIRIPEDKNAYSSCVVGIDKPHLLLDELLPIAGQQSLQNAGMLRVACKLDGIDIRFKCKLERIEAGDNLVTNLMHIPDKLEYRQRRQYYRVNIPMSQELHVNMHGVASSSGKEMVIKGLLHDLSLGGAGMVFPTSNVDTDIGRIYQCTLELTEHKLIHCMMEIRYSKATGLKNQHFIGARFLDLKPEQSRLVSRSISELEREFIRKRAQYD